MASEVNVLMDFNNLGMLWSLVIENNSFGILKLWFLKLLNFSESKIKSKIFFTFGDVFIGINLKGDFWQFLRGPDQKSLSMEKWQS